jgi:GTP pyrophosphokinase
MGRYHDPLKPRPGETFSKRQVDRAGELLRVFFCWEPSTGELPEWTGSVSRAFAAVAWWRTQHARPLSKAANALRYHVARENALVAGRIDVTQRLKRTSTIGDKLSREPTMKVTQMQDVGGVRARLPSLHDVHAVSRRLKKSWTIHRTRDYIANPKSSGYRALHHVVRRDGCLIEVQLRTTLQDAWANQVEEDSEETGIGFKFGRGDDSIHDYYVLVSCAFALVDDDKPVPEDLAQALARSYARIKDVLPRSAR